MVSKVRGQFNDFAGSFVIDGADVSKSSASLTIQAGSIDTNNTDRDGHLKSAEFLDTDQFGEITFTSTSAAAKGDDAVGIVSAEGGETGGDDVEIGVWRDPGEDGRG